MMRGIGLQGFLLTLLLVSSASAVDFKAGSWTESVYGHIRIVTDAESHKIANLAYRLAELEHALDVLFPVMQSGFGERLTVIAFRKARDYREFSPTGSSKDVPAYVSPRARESLMVLHLEDLERNRMILQHEFVHYWVHKHVPFLPMWVNEGLADFFSTAEVDHDEITVGFVVPLRRDMLAYTKSLLPASALVKQGTYDWSHGAGYEMARFYAQSWLAVHYFLMRGYGDELGRYIAAIRERQDPHEAFQEIFGVSDEAFDRILREHFRTITAQGLSAKVQLDGVFIVQRDTTRILDEAAFNCHLGNIHFRDDESALRKARSCFDRALELDPGSADAWCGRARVELLMDRPDQWQSDLRTAIEIDPDHFEAVLELGANLLANPDSMQVARSLLVRALEIDPSDPYALGFYALSLMDVNPTRGLQAMQVVLPQLPWVQRFSAGAIVMKVNVGDMAGAQADLEEFRKWADSVLVTWLEDRLAEAESQ